MKQLLILFALLTFFSCQVQKNKPAKISGTWKLISGTLIENGDTTVTRYSNFIKIINDSHFGFFNHDVNPDSMLVSGGGRYELQGDQYTEHLEYCSDRAWEGHDFIFTVRIKNDTLVQSGFEKIEARNINRLNIERYVRIAN